MQDLLTIKEISSKTTIPPSTLRYYRDIYCKYIPAIGEGRERRYEPWTLDIFLTISKATKEGKNKRTIYSLLEQKFSNSATNTTQNTHETAIYCGNETAHIEYDKLSTDISDISIQPLLNIINMVSSSLITKQQNEIQRIQDKINEIKEMETFICSKINSSLSQPIETQNKEYIFNLILEMVNKTDN